MKSPAISLAAAALLLVSGTPAGAAPDAPLEEQGVWYACLETYAQIAMFSTQSGGIIAMAAMAACPDERKAFQMALLRQPPAPGALPLDGPAFADALAEADRVAVRHVITFLTRTRPALDHH